MVKSKVKIVITPENKSRANVVKECRVKRKVQTLLEFWKTI